MFLQNYVWRTLQRIGELQLAVLWPADVCATMRWCYAARVLPFIVWPVN